MTATAVLVISARGYATTAVPFVVAISSGACWRALPTSWYLPRLWQLRCAPTPRRPIARTMNGGRRQKLIAAPLRRLRGASKGSWMLSRMVLPAGYESEDGGAGAAEGRDRGASRQGAGRPAGRAPEYR